MNADDVEACIAAVRLAVAFRNEFGRDALIDLIGYRRFGHNETDEPAYTQPAMYETIKKHPPVREVYADAARERGRGLARRTPQKLADDAYARVADAHAELKETIAGPPDTGQHELDRTMSREPKTTLPEDLLRSLNEQIVQGAGRLQRAPQAEAVPREAPRRGRAGRNGRLGARRVARRSPRCWRSACRSG